MNRKIISTKNAPQAIGPYSQAVHSNQFIFVAGQIGIQPSTGNIVDGGIEAETHQVLTNVKNILEAAGSSLDQVVRTTVYLKNIDDFSCMNQIYSTFFKNNPPARSTIQVAALPKGALIEIDAIAMLAD